MHIVSLKKGLSVEEAKKDSEGIAVLGFFINVCIQTLFLMHFTFRSSHEKKKTVFIYVRVACMFVDFRPIIFFIANPNPFKLFLTIILHLGMLL